VLVHPRVLLECLVVEFLGPAGGEEICQHARSSEYQQRMEQESRVEETSRMCCGRLDLVHRVCTVEAAKEASSSSTGEPHGATCRAA